MALVLAETMAGVAWAGPPEGPSEPPSTSDGDPADAYLLENDEEGEDEDEREIVIDTERPENDDRDASVVTRRQIQERLPRSAPDALRYENVTVDLERTVTTRAASSSPTIRRPAGLTLTRTDVSVR